MSPDSTCAPAAVTVCGTKSLLIHVTRSPFFTSRRSGTNFIPSMTTRCSAACAAQPSTSATAASARRTSALLAKGALDLLRMLEVCRDYRAGFREQILQLRVLGARDEDLV